MLYMRVIMFNQPRLIWTGLIHFRYHHISGNIHFEKMGPVGGKLDTVCRKVILAARLELGDPWWSKTTQMKIVLGLTELDFVEESQNTLWAKAQEYHPRLMTNHFTYKKKPN